MWDLPTLDAVKTGQRIKELRRKAEFTVEEFSEAIGLRGSKVLVKWENGETSPSLVRVLQMADIFGVKVEDIVVRMWNGKAV